MNIAISQKLLWGNKKSRLEYHLPIVKEHMIRILSTMHSFICIDTLCCMIQNKYKKIDYYNLKNLIIDLGHLNNNSFIMNDYDTEIKYNHDDASLYDISIGI